MNIIMWLNKKFNKGRSVNNPLCAFKAYRYLRGGQWVHIDWHWLRIDKTGILRDVQGQNYTYSIPPSCIREYHRMKR